MKLLASDLANAIGGRLVGPDTDIDGATFDSRQVLHHQLFVPIVAERDGHEFISDALKAGAGVYLTSRPELIEGLGGTGIVVDDTAQALIDAARWGRTQFPASTVVIGVTGSVGKTSTKDLIVAALSSAKRVVANVRSFNNEQGLPVTILNASLATEVLVLEMGMRGLGQIDDLCRIARPHIGVVTRVGEAHTELVGGLDGVVQAKGELIEALPPQGVAILNADDERVIAMRSRSVAPVLSFGESISADIRIANLHLDAHGCALFDIFTPSESATVNLSIPGRHMALNAAAAITVGEALGVDLELMVESLRSASISDRRMQSKTTKSGALLLDDCYNANPTSMAAAIETLAQIPADRKVAVLGVMAEIENPEKAYTDIARLARANNIDIIAVGTSGYGTNSLTVDEVIEQVSQCDRSVAILVKGSRVAALERVVDAVIPG
ncbi:MAG: UDP-N-acetylmuramoyl-tripeptide--D-alanyl-D-alanine ligase [Actinomycetota bacterium]|nr:UDP-N-acetylmuramoyl-tripeptide--D-alanyl-D-alanine ligase [Actinomycetota bacterium]MDA3019053.1 UDP-N-acetylmuramoyl-tripeptide--D-alanyl-D-alanine ligase [Actinomycetota bacterium]